MILKIKVARQILGFFVVGISILVSVCKVFHIIFNFFNFTLIICINLFPSIFICLRCVCRYNFVMIDKLYFFGRHYIYLIVVDLFVLNKY